jgi:hypothetical protein
MVVTRSIKIDHSQWDELKTRLRKDYSPSIVLVRSKMKNTLGFVDREHIYYDKQYGFVSCVYLDFYNDSKKTMFLLKYSDYFNNENRLS